MALIKFKKKRRPKRWRLLWSYQGIAKKQYDRCGCCPHPIFPGEEYVREVWVSGKNLSVSRDHVFCPDPWEDWDDEDKSKKEEKSLSAAA